MTTGRLRVDEAVAPSAVAPNHGATRSRAVPGRHVDPAPTTAQLIRRTDASIARPTYAALGVALHHFTDVLTEAIDPIVLHRATTVLTKQVCQILDDHDDDVLDDVRRLVTDPDRVALPDGRPAAELCDQAWERVRAVALQRATASCEGADEFGHDAIINLAAVRGVGAVTPWWGTPMWRQRVELMPADAISSRDRELLLAEPERADDDLVSLVLNDTLLPPRRRPTTPGSTAPVSAEIEGDAGATTTRASAALAS